MDWNSIAGLSSVIRNANWGIAASVLFTFLFTVIVIVADKKRETLTAKADLAKEEEIAGINKLAGDANERAGKLEKEAAELTAQNLKLEAAIAPRRLSGRQEKTLSALTRFSGRTIGIKSYSSDTEGLILATQIFDALTKSGLPIEDNRLTMLPSGSVSFGVAVEGPDIELVQKLKRILSMDGNLTASGTIASTNRGGVSISNAFGRIISATPPVATITIGVKPIK